jgi:hypothetical protein
VDEAVAVDSEAAVEVIVEEEEGEGALEAVEDLEGTEVVGEEEGEVLEEEVVAEAGEALEEEVRKLLVF